MKTGRPLKFQTVEELQEKIDNYFEERKAGKKPYTVTSLAIYLDVYRETISNYGERDEFFDTVKRAKEKILAWKEDQLYRTTQVAGTIFDLKNNYPDIYKDKREYEGNINIKENDLKTLSNEELNSKLESINSILKENDK
ncbi:MAG TPA: terminase small subunit [Anaerolineae bacterium]|nr:terminase small subunit [Anaerolineae bacterium]